jgi:hypothetical protein
MNKEIVASFLLALCVVGGALFAFVKFSGGGNPPAPAASATAGGPIARPLNPCPGGKMLQGECHVPAPGQPGAWIRLSDLQRGPARAPATMNVAQGGITEQERQQLAEFAQQQRADDIARAQLNALAQAQQPDDHATCAAIDQRITAIDAITRQPLSGTTQDYYKAERKRLLDRKFSLRC